MRHLRKLFAFRQSGSKFFLLALLLPALMPASAWPRTETDLVLTFTVLTPVLDVFSLGTFDADLVNRTLFQGTLRNTSDADIRATAELIFTRQSTGAELRILSNLFTIFGNETITISNIDLSIGSDSRFQASRLPGEAEIKQFLEPADRTGFVPQDLYGILLKISPTTGGSVSGSGTINVINPFRIDLINPVHRSVVNSLFPTIMWSSNASGPFILTIVPESLSDQEILRTVPVGARVFQAPDLRTTVFTYPSFAEALKDGNTYCAQISGQISLSVGGESFLESAIHCFTIRLIGIGEVDPLMQRLKSKYPNEISDALLDRLKGYKLSEAGVQRILKILSTDAEIIEVRVEQK